LNRILPLTAACACLLLTACASERDHFYVLNILPQDARATAAAPTLHVLLSVSVPSVVDRAEMVVGTSDNGILVLDHDRWAGTFADQIAQTLARDIEKRRSDVLVGDRGFGQAATPSVTLRVDIVRMVASLGGSASVEAHWRIVDAGAGVDEIGGDVFTVPVPVDGTGYAAVARAYSQALSSLADKLSAGVRRR
jgi:uncharacterized lipoprotein YmbA